MEKARTRLYQPTLQKKVEYRPISVELTQLTTCFFFPFYILYNKYSGCHNCVHSSRIYIRTARPGRMHVVVVVRCRFNPKLSSYDFG